MASITEYDLMGMERHAEDEPKDLGRRTTVYHIAYAPEISKAYLFHWGCNLRCKGCLCLKEINCLALEENLDVVFRNPRLKAPQRPSELLFIEEVMERLKGKEVREVLFEGQEASIDPCLPELCRRIKEEHGNPRIILNTNGVRLPDLSNVDEVVFSLKAVTPEVYEYYTERPMGSLLDNFKKVSGMDSVLLRAESVLIPGVIGLDETERIAKYVASVDRSIPYRIDAYFESGDNLWKRATPGEMKEAVDTAKGYLDTVTCTQQTEKVLKKEDLMFSVERLY